MVIKTNGNMVPGMIGPPPWMNAVTLGISIGGARTITPSANSTTTPIFMNVER